MAKDTQTAEGHRLKFLKAAHEIVGKGLDKLGRMWIHSIEGGTSYGALSGDNDVAIINDYSRNVKSDIYLHFASVCLDSLESDIIYVAESNSMVIFTPSTNSTTGVFGATVLPAKLPSLRGVCEAPSKHMVNMDQVTAVNRSFKHLGSSYKCVPVMLGSKRYMAFTGKGRKWSAVILCHASRIDDSVLDALSAGWLVDRPEPPGELSWDTIPRPVRKIMAVGLGLTKRRFTSNIEQKLLTIDASRAFKSLSLDYIESIGREIGVTGKNASAKKVLNALMEQGQVEKST